MRGGKVHAIRVTKDLEMTCVAQRSRLQQRIKLPRYSIFDGRCWTSLSFSRQM